MIFILVINILFFTITFNFDKSEYLNAALELF